jgi:hypothetical protein
MAQFSVRLNEMVGLNAHRSQHSVDTYTHYYVRSGTVISVRIGAVETCIMHFVAAFFSVFPLD